jgi:hypothetical protein
MTLLEKYGQNMARTLLRELKNNEQMCGQSAILKSVSRPRLAISQFLYSCEPYFSDLKFGRIKKYFSLMPLCAEGVSSKWNASQNCSQTSRYCRDNLTASPQKHEFEAEREAMQILGQRRGNCR